jgi:autotransporter-associated beta strand protein
VALPTGDTTITVTSGISAIFDTNKDLTGTGALVKDGDGTLELLGNDNDFSGGLTVNGGTVTTTGTTSLSIGSDVTGNNYLGSGDITVNSGGTLLANLSGASAINVASGATIENNGGTITLSSTDNNTSADLNFSGTLSQSGGTTTIAVGDDIALNSGSSIQQTGGTINLNAGGDFTTSGASISVSGNSQLNVDLTPSTGSGDTFTLASTDAITLDGASAAMTITSPSTSAAVNFNGAVNLNNGSELTVISGTTYLSSASILNGGTGATKGTLTIEDGNLSLDEPVVYNAPNITMDSDIATQITAPNTGSSITNLGVLTKSGSGTTTINSNLQNIAATEIQITGGTLLLGTSNQIDNATQMTLAGGTFATGGNSETLSTLTLSSTSTIDMGGSSSQLEFVDGGTYSSGSLNIENWSGTPGYGGGTDKIIFGQSLSAAFLNSVVWKNINGQDVYGAIQLASGEIVPIPEASTLMGGGLLSLLAIAHYRRNRNRVS